MEGNVPLIRFSGGASAMLKSIAFYNDIPPLLSERFVDTISFLFGVPSDFKVPDYY